ncbi:DNA topoisomerase IB [Chelatococcus reniformis]|uniref:DNA topoisomerase I n=1 Tax=Chelatococcus reniformis TaxID=1494448 RepID=A0A916X9L1_9HYPH|nr:DNA topoisomerase IB [Chelatococcus reniformis]GGC54897.1 DNA topoisomerase I [Chelatococcus reniformis]
MSDSAFAGTTEATSRRRGVPPAPSRDSASARARKNLIARLAAAAGLKLVTPGDLTIERLRDGDRFVYVLKSGRHLGDASLKDRSARRRLDKLAVPPAYTNVFYAADPRAHIQAIGTDAAGRLQYRYHADWTDVREALKARRLVHLVEALPAIRRQILRDIADIRPSRERALASIVRLVERTAIRAGNQSYERLSGSRGATTLCKSNIRLRGQRISLSFSGKGGKATERSFEDDVLAASLRGLMQLPGERIFQYLDDREQVRPLDPGDVNTYLRQAAGRVISLKDFRTLIASSEAVEALSEMAPAPSERRRKSQILEAVRQVADGLSNTPAVARKSYIHASVIDAFEAGRLMRLRKRMKAKPFSPRRERLLLCVVRAAAQS